MGRIMAERVRGRVALWYSARLVAKALFTLHLFTSNSKKYINKHEIKINIFQIKINEFQFKINELPIEINKF